MTYVTFSEMNHDSIVNALIEHIESMTKIKVVTGIIPINVCAHCGPGTIGLLASPKINGKSILDFAK